MKFTSTFLKRLSRKDLSEITGRGSGFSDPGDGNGGTNNGGTSGNILSCATTSMCFPQVVQNCRCVDPPPRN